MPIRSLNLTHLRLFDAAARHRNLSRAAAELGVSQPAASYSVRALEEQLGRPLFLRRHRGLEPTAAGRALGAAVRAGLNLIDQAADDIVAHAPARTVRIATDYAFAAFWLMPRVADFRREHADVDVHIVASQTPRTLADADIAISFGRRSDVGPAATLLLPERVTTICSPTFLARHGPFDDPRALAEAPLLQLEPLGGARWYDWTRWLAGVGVARAAGRPHLGLNTYTLVVQAALADQGIALGWLGLIDGLLDGGALARACPLELVSDCGYWLTARDTAPDTRLVADWIRGAFAVG